MSDDRHAQAFGFTLIELMLVVSIVAAVAAIAVPNLVRAKMASNESSAVSTLRNLGQAQIACSNRKFIDVDLDGQGEYAFFGEMSGSVPARNNPGASLLPPLLSGAFRTVSAGQVRKSGYEFAIYLPDVAGQGLFEDAANYANVDPANAEQFWCAYAWPTDFRVSGQRAFFVSQVGEVLFTKNETANYSGTATTPTFDAAFAVAGSMLGTYSVGVPATDGETWVVLN